jgi:hypothetical protein
MDDSISNDSKSPCFPLFLFYFVVLVEYLEKLIVVQFEAFSQILLEVSDIRDFIISVRFICSVCSEHSVTGMVYV